MDIHGGERNAPNSCSVCSALAMTLLLWSLSLGATGANAGAIVAPRIETPALIDDAAGGNANADDPAIWVHPRLPQASLVIGTKKDAGLSVYNLHGREVQAISVPPAPEPDAEPGRFNNVDVLYGFSLDGHAVDVAVTTDRGRDQLRFYAINPEKGGLERQPLRDVTVADAPFVFSRSQDEVNEQRTAYGLALWQDATGAYAFVSQRHRTVIAKVRFFDAGDGHINYEVVASITLPRSFTLPDNTQWESCQEPEEEPQVEGMVVDSGRNLLYAAQEDIGVWRLGTDLSTPTLIDKVREFGVPWEFDAEEEECTVHYEQDPGFAGQHLTADAEGLTIYYGPGLSGYLLAASQGDSTFVVYERAGNNAYLGTYEVGVTPGQRIDGAQHSDGTAVMNVPLNGTFPSGLLVVHDGENLPEMRNEEGEARENTNFKFVPWGDVARAFTPPLLIDRISWDPRQ